MRAFLVLGPESSGTRLMTKLLISAGCNGDDGNRQRFDAVPAFGDHVVWRRSLPHGGVWPNLSKCVSRLRSAGYSVLVVVMSRDWNAIQLSQVASGHVDETFVAHNHIREAYRIIFNAITREGVDYEIVNYEMLCGHELAVSSLLERLGLTSQEPVAIYDGNAKYYQGGEDGE